MVPWLIWTPLAYLLTIAPSNTLHSTPLCLEVNTRSWAKFLKCISFLVTHMDKAFRCAKMFPQRALTQVTPTHTSSTKMPKWCSPSTICIQHFMGTTPCCLIIGNPSSKLSINLRNKLRTPIRIKSNQTASMIYLRLSQNAKKSRQGEIATVRQMISKINSLVVNSTTKDTTTRRRRWICQSKSSNSSLILYSLPLNLVLWMSKSKFRASSAYHFTQSPSILVATPRTVKTKTSKVKMSKTAITVSSIRSKLSWSRWGIHIPMCNLSVNV